MCLFCANFVLNKSTLHHITCASRFNIILMRNAHPLYTHNINMKRVKMAHEQILSTESDIHLCCYAFWFASRFYSLHLPFYSLAKVVKVVKKKVIEMAWSSFTYPNKRRNALKNILLLKLNAFPNCLSLSSLYLPHQANCKI